MDKQLQQWLKVAKQVRLTSAEHASIRSSITSFSTSSVQKVARKAVLSPLEKDSIRQQLLRSVRTSTAVTLPWWQALLPRMHTMALACIFLVLVSASGSAVYAAEDTVPGDALYTVKTTVTEPFLGAFHRSNERHAEFLSWQHQRRTHELERITSDPTLTTDERLEMALVRVEQHTQKVELLLSNLSVDSPERIRHDLEQRIEKEQAILLKLQSGEISPEQLERMRLKGRLPRPPKPPVQNSTGGQNILVPEDGFVRQLKNDLRLELRDDRLLPPPQLERFEPHDSSDTQTRAARQRTSPTSRPERNPPAKEVQAGSRSMQTAPRS